MASRLAFFSRPYFRRLSALRVVLVRPGCPGEAVEDDQDDRADDRDEADQPPEPAPAAVVQAPDRRGDGEQREHHVEDVRQGRYFGRGGDYLDDHVDDDQAQRVPPERGSRGAAVEGGDVLEPL